MPHSKMIIWMLHVTFEKNNKYKHMKYILTIALFFTLLFNSAYGANDKLTIHFETQFDIEIVQIFKIQQGGKVLINEFPLNKGEKKSVTDQAAHGFYIVSFNRVSKKIYASAKQDVSLLFKKNDITLKKPSKENKLIENWFVMSEPARNLSLKYYKSPGEDVVKPNNFYNKQRTLEKKSVTFLKQVEKYHGDSYFKEAIKMLVDSDLTYFKLYYTKIPLLGVFQLEQAPQDLYGSIPNSKRMANPILLDVVEYMNPYVQLYCYYNQFVNLKSKQFKPLLTYVPSPEIKVAYLLDNGFRLQDGSGLEKIEKKHLNLFTSGYPLEQLEKLREQFAYLKDPSKLPDFEFKNPKGDTVSFSSFRGKNLIVIDVWATWCAPCKKSRPYFEALAEEMKDSGVTFMGLSIDDSEMKWKKYVEKSDIIELLDHKKALTKAYGVSSVPNYLIFGADGKLLKKSAPKPDNGELKKVILDFLNTTN